VALAWAAATPLHAAVCTVDAAVLAFPPYDAFNAAPNLATGSIRVLCMTTPGISDSATVALRIGSSNHGTVNERKMSNGRDQLRYGLYSDSARSQNWGDGFDAPTRNSGPLNAELWTPVVFPVFGSMPPMQNIAPGNYSDNLMITVTP
jgi:spore coat protein U-like protein